MTDIFASDRQSQQGRFNDFYESVVRATQDSVVWVAYYASPGDCRTTRLELRQDLFGVWAADRYTPSRLTRRSCPELVEACKVAFGWTLTLEQAGMLKTIESAATTQFSGTKTQNGGQTQIDSRKALPAPAWVQGLISAFTLHNDWVDLATCLSMSADEYVDANWRRFRDWLGSVRKCPPTDPEVYAFGLAVWNAYRHDTLV